MNGGDVENSTLTVGCNWSGDYYGPEYVNRLYAAVERNLTLPHDFVLYAGPGVEARRSEVNPAVRIVQTGLPSWWSGMMFWMADPPGIRTPAVLYLDLDVVVCGRLDEIAAHPGDLVCMKDFPSWSCPDRRRNDANASVTLLRRGAGLRVWLEYCRAGCPTRDIVRDPGGTMRMAAQGVMNDPVLAMPKEFFPEDRVCSYKYEVLKRGLPADARVVAFHGRPKPHEVGDAFVREHWRE